MARDGQGAGVMTPDFNAADISTWTVTLTAEQVAAIYQRPLGGIKKACQLKTFVPAPFLVHPYRWRKADVLRHVDGGRALRQVS